jgi:hypothetical protein
VPRSDNAISRQFRASRRYTFCDQSKPIANPEKTRYVPRLQKKRQDLTRLRFLYRRIRRTFLQATILSFGPGEVYLRTGLSDDMYLAFVELSKRNLCMPMSGVSALTAEMCMRAEVRNALHKYIYSTILILLDIMSEHAGNAAFDNASIRCDELTSESLHGIPNCITLCLHTRFGFDMSLLGYNAYRLFENAFEKGSKDFGNRAVADLYSIKMRPGEGALDLMTRVQVAEGCW